jgi:hypothetical protein
MQAMAPQHIDDLPRHEERDGDNNDDESHKRQISRSDLFFALRAGPRLQV